MRSTGCLLIFANFRAGHGKADWLTAMNVSSENSVSLWMSTKVLENAPALGKTEKADVVVVGSGIAGISVAWRAH